MGFASFPSCFLCRSPNPQFGTVSEWVNRSTPHALGLQKKVKKGTRPLPLLLSGFCYGIATQTEQAQHDLVTLNHKSTKSLWHTTAFRFLRIHKRRVRHSFLAYRKKTKPVFGFALSQYYNTLWVYKCIFFVPFKYIKVIPKKPLFYPIPNNSRKSSKAKTTNSPGSFFTWVTNKGLRPSRLAISFTLRKIA